MELLRSVDELPRGLRFALSIGVFDGVHRGHCRVLAALRRVAGQVAATPVVITFEPHPEAVLRGTPPPLLTDPQERLARLGAAGAAIVVLQPFDRAFAAQPAERFIERLAAGRDLGALVMTPESAFGHDRAGTAEVIARLAASMGFHLTTEPALDLAGARVSSSRIRRLIEAGRLAEARQLLGRRYAVVGEIVHGDGRGRELGYPTANFGFQEPVVLPPDGIYAVRLSWAGRDPLQPARRAEGVASLGVRPTFGVGGRVLEAFLFDLDEDLYGERMRLEFVRRQRGERRFRDAAALVRQMDADVGRARRLLAQSSSLAGPEAAC